MARGSKITEATVIARQLHEVKANLKDLKEEEHELTTLLLEALRAEGKKREGRFTRSFRTGIKFVDMRKAMLWAKEQNAITIDRPKAIRILKRSLQTPDGIEMTETEYISVAPEKLTDKDDTYDTPDD